MDDWDLALQSFELHLLVTGAAPGTIGTRMPSARHMAAALAATGISAPEDVTSGALTVYLIGENRRRTGAGALTHHNSLRSFWEWWAADYEPGLPSPMARVGRPAARSPQRPVLTDEQMAAILAACRRSFTGLRDRALISCLVSTGARRAEAIALTVADVDIRAREILIRRGKGGKGRVVPFDPRAADALGRYAMARDRRLGHPDDSSPFWVNRSGEPLSYGSLGQLTRRLGRRAGVPGLGPHLFRHKWADTLLRAGIPEHDIAKLAGWTTTAQLNRYGAAVAGERAVSAVRAYYDGLRGRRL
jgi:site-specific recombinase XerD